MFTIIFYEYENGAKGAMLVQGQLAYVWARKKCPEEARYTGCKYIDRFDMMIGLEYLANPRINH